MVKFAKIMFVAVFMGILVFPMSNSYAGDETPATELFETKCSTCHDKSIAENIHLSKDSFVDIIKRMITKRNAQISEMEASQVAEYLGHPERSVFNNKCLKCHGMDKMAEAHLKGRLTVQTIKSMKDKGADISDNEAESLYEGPVLYYFPRKKK